VNSRDPKLVALLFNECITRHDLYSLSALMSDDHLFVDRDGNTVQSKVKMTSAWEEFFKLFPAYRNTFVRVDSNGDEVVMIGFAFWNEEKPSDPAIWTAHITNDLVAEWWIHYDTPENRDRLGVS
jgi:predicted SnoaL-like aldol condensation-catalyzing enzyme